MSKTFSFLNKSFLVTLGYFFSGGLYNGFSKDVKILLEIFFRNAIGKHFNAASAQLPQNEIFTPQMQSWAVLSIQLEMQFSLKLAQ